MEDRFPPVSTSNYHRGVTGIAQSSQGIVEDQIPPVSTSSSREPVVTEKVIQLGDYRFHVKQTITPKASQGEAEGSDFPPLPSSAKTPPTRTLPVRSLFPQWTLTEAAALREISKNESALEAVEGRSSNLRPNFPCIYRPGTC